MAPFLFEAVEELSRNLLKRFLKRDVVNQTQVDNFDTFNLKDPSNIQFILKSIFTAYILN